MNKEFALFIEIILLIVAFIIFTLIMRLYLSIKKEKRISNFSIDPLNYKTISFSDKILHYYKKIISSISKVLKKSLVMKDYSKLYVRYLSLNSNIIKEEMDFISNKIIYGILAISITIISFVFRNRNFSFPELIMAFLFGFFSLDVYLLVKKTRLKKNLENDLYKAIIIMNNAFKSGRSIMQAVEDVALELDGEMSKEFQKMYIDLTYGLDLKDVFDRFYDRVRLDEIKYIESSLVIINKTGGDIVKVFSSVEKGFTDRMNTKNELESTIALSKFTSVFLSILPIALVVIVLLFDPNYFSLFFTSIMGRLLLLLIIIIYISYIVIVIRLSKLKE